MATEKNRMSVGRYVFGSIITIVMVPAVFLFLSGDWLWPEGWIFSLWLDAMIMSNSLYLYLRDPALLAERSRVSGFENQKTWDKYLIIVIFAIALVWLIIMPLDVRRFGWSPAFPLWLKTLGGVALLPALYLIYQATVENTFLSTAVRIQTERKQYVISTGVYGFVRHPLYLGCLLMMLGAPLLLGSLYGLIIALLGVPVLVGRVFGEERMLVDELEGYEDYKKKVRYRLIPFIW